LALLKANNDPEIPSRYKTNDDAIGAAAFIQGYAALLGFGITLTRNQAREEIPTK
jgi:hypothetical protein